MTVKVITTKRGIPSDYIPLTEVRKAYGDHVAQNLSHAVYANGVQAVKLMKTLQGPKGGTSRGRVFVNKEDFATWMQRTPHSNTKHAPALKPEHITAQVAAQPQEPPPIATAETIFQKILNAKINAILESQLRTEATVNKLAEAWGLSATRQ